MITNKNLNISKLEMEKSIILGKCTSFYIKQFYYKFIKNKIISINNTTDIG